MTGRQVARYLRITYKCVVNQIQAKPQCHHEGDKSDFHPQFCRKCGEEFAYVHPYLLPVSPDK